MNRYRGYQWKVLKKGDVTRWTEINEVWNQGHHKLRTTSRFCVRCCHNPIHSPILAVCHFLLLPLPLCITVSFSHVSCLFISMAFVLFYLSRWLAHTTPIPPPDRSCNKFMNTSNEYSLSESSVLVGHCLHYFMLMHETQFLCMWDEWHRHTICFAIDCSSVSFQNCFWDYPCVGTCMCVFIQTMLYIYYLCQDPAFLFMSIKLQWLTNTSHICICLKKEKSSWICPFLHQRLRGLFWTETHPLSKFFENMFSSLCNPLDKPTNSPTNLMTGIVKKTLVKWLLKIHSL